MGHLESITSPRDLRDPLRPTSSASWPTEIRDVLISTCARTGGHLGPNLGVVELTLAIHRVFDSPRDRVVFDTGHQSYVHKLVTGRADRLRHPAPGGRPQRLPQPGRVRARHRRELPRLDRPVLRRRPGQGLRDPWRGPPRRGGHRRRRPHRRHGLGGAQQHRHRAATAAGHRGQRQRALLHPDHRRPRHRADARCAPTRATSRSSTWSRSGSTRCPASAHAAYDALHAIKKGMKDVAGPAGPLRGPRPQVRRPRRRPRPGSRRGGARAQAKRFGGPVIVHALTRKGCGYDPAERHEADQFHAPGPFDVQTGAEKPKGKIWTDHFSEAIVELGRAPRGRRRHHRGDDAPGRARRLRRAVPRAHLRRRHRRAARRHLGRRPGDGRAAPGLRGLRDLPQPRLRPGPDGRRAAPVRGHLRARPLRRHRRRRRQPQRHVGHVDPAGRARPAPRRARATSRGCASCSTRRSRSTTRPTVVRFPKGPPPADIPAIGQGRRRRRARPRTATATC